MVTAKAIAQGDFYQDQLYTVVLLSLVTPCMCAAVTCQLQSIRSTEVGQISQLLNKPGFSHHQSNAPG